MWFSGWQHTDIGRKRLWSRKFFNAPSLRTVFLRTRNCIPLHTVGKKLSRQSSVRSPEKSPSGEMADAADSKSAGAQVPCRFDSDLGHQFGVRQLAAAL